MNQMLHNWSLLPRHKNNFMGQNEGGFLQVEVDPLIWLDKTNYSISK
jgi:hypothetical protein